VHSARVRGMDQRILAEVERVDDRAPVVAVGFNGMVQAAWQPAALNRWCCANARFVQVEQAALPVAGGELKFVERRLLHGEGIFVTLFLRA